VAIYSEADRKRPFVKYADEAVCVGPPRVPIVFTRVTKIIQVCMDLSVDGIHPGYGFLSEKYWICKEK
jgi:propionyl-CoA carboxylase alpha chain